MIENIPSIVIESYHVPAHVEVQRLSDFAIGIFETIISRKGLKKAIKNGLVYIDGKQGYTGDYIKGGEVIDLYQSQVVKKRPKVDLLIEVLYEDDYLAVVNKPAGIEVSGNKRRTLENALPENLKQSTLIDALQYPEPIHRLDYPTSGVLLVGKTKSSVITLNKLFEDKEIQKIYNAISIGRMSAQGAIREDIEGKKSETIYSVIDTMASEKFGSLNLVELIPLTGRRHQLRIHLSQMGNPILGDVIYCSPEQLLKGKGLFLHALSLCFIHPLSRQKIFVKGVLPKKFIKLIEYSVV